MIDNERLAEIRARAGEIVIVTMTIGQFRQSIKDSEGCPKCGCKLLESLKRGYQCARCNEPYKFPGGYKDAPSAPEDSDE